MQDNYDVPPQSPEPPRSPVPPPPPTMQRRRRSRWWIPLAIIAGLCLVVVVFIGVFVSFITSGFSGSEKSVSVRDNSVLVVDLSSGLPERASSGGLFGTNTSTSVLRAVTSIRRAATDSRIKGIYYKAGGAGMGFAKLAEVRDALTVFKGSGKFIYAYIDAGSKGHYYLASVADSIFMPSEGMLEFNAFGASSVFMKGLFDKIGVEWYVQQYEEYKSAGESMSRTNWSAPAKEEVRALVEQRQAMFIDAVASGRSIDVPVVRALLDSGVYSAQEAMQARLIDGIAMESAVRDRIRHRLGTGDTTKSGAQKLRMVNIGQYWSSSDDRESSKEAIDDSKTIAIVYASGAIMPGKDNNDPFGGGEDGVRSASLIKALREAGNDSDVKAIILRIDSPGGSVLASDEIWSAILDIRKKKPVYASMSDVAASGGYYIAMACDTIIAHPATITGSIGVILSIPNLSGTMNKLGLTVDTVNLGRSTNFMNPMMPFSQADRDRLARISEPIYRRFVQKVADARKKSFDDARALAKGRVWTGSAAHAAGLIDVQGGLYESIQLVKRRLGVDSATKVPLAVYPQSVDRVEAILKLLGLEDGSSDEDDADATAPASVRMLFTKAMGADAQWERVWATLPPDIRNQVYHMASLTDIGMREHSLYMLPNAIEPF